MNHVLAVLDAGWPDVLNACRRKRMNHVVFAHLVLPVLVSAQRLSA